MHSLSLSLLVSPRLILVTRRKILNYCYVPQHQVPATEAILQLDHNLFTPTEILAFKMIELGLIQKEYLTRENILLKEHIVALKGIIRKLEDLLRLMCDYPSSPPYSSPTKET